MYHYVYILIDLLPTSDKTYYIGVRSSSSMPDMDPYMGSSKSMTKEEKSRCDKLVLAEFTSRQEAISYEIYLYNKFDVATNPVFYNNAKQTSKRFDTSGKTFTFSDEHIKNMSLAARNRDPSTYAKGWNHSEQAIKRIREAKQGKPRDEATKDKLSKSMKNVYRSGYIHPKKDVPLTQKQKDAIRLARIKEKAFVSISNPKFTPWFITYPNGITEKFTDKTKRQVAIERNLSLDCFTALASTSKGITPIKKGLFKGHIIGNIVDDIV